MKRHSLGLTGMTEDPEGEWVRYSEYKRQTDRLKEVANVLVAGTYQPKRFIERILGWFDPETGELK